MWAHISFSLFHAYAHWSHPLAQYLLLVGHGLKALGHIHGFEHMKMFSGSSISFPFFLFWGL